MPAKAKNQQNKGTTTKDKKTKANGKDSKTQGTRARAKAKEARVEGDVGVAKKETVVVAVAPVKKKGAAAKGGEAKGGGSTSKGTLVAAALGVAAAAAAGVAAFKTMAGKKRKVFHLMPHEEGWQVTRAGKSSPEAVHGKKRKARSEARDMARDNEPSQLVIHRADGTIQTVHTYGE